MPKFASFQQTSKQQEINLFGWLFELVLSIPDSNGGWGHEPPKALPSARGPHGDLRVTQKDGVESQCRKIGWL